MNTTLTPRLVGMMVAVSLVVGWIGSSMMQGTAPAQSPNAGGLRPLGGQPTMAPHAEALRQRSTEPPIPSRGRNPFVFSTRAPRPSADRDRQPEVATAPPMALPLPAPLPVVRLSGVASTVQDGVAVLTAILNDNGAMVFAKAGDRLSRGYTVVRVEELSVTLSDADGVTQTIRLP